jgi:hypothetical protein
MSDWQFHATPDAVAELLRGGGEYVEPAKILNDIGEVHAAAVPPGSPHSIAQIVSHMHYWQKVNIAKAKGEPAPRPARLDDTFTSPLPGTWRHLVNDFLAGIEECGRIAREKADVTSPARDDTSLDYDLAESALHNAYHLGQIVLLRRIMGLWPPEGGDDNDF